MQTNETGLVLVSASIIEEGATPHSSPTAARRHQLSLVIINQALRLRQKERARTLLDVWSGKI